MEGALWYLKETVRFSIEPKYQIARLSSFSNSVPYPPIPYFFTILSTVLLVPSPVAVAVAEDNRRENNSHHTQREDHLGYHFGTFWGPMEPLWIVEIHRLNWFWPGALIYTWLRQSLAKWTCHPAPAALLSHPLVWRQDTLGEASTTALADLVRVPGWHYLPYHLCCSCAAPSLSDSVEVSTWSTNFWVKHQPMRKLSRCKVLCAMFS